MGELVRSTGLSRQWISRIAAFGEVPGARRKSSGRWDFCSSPKLEEWIERMGRRTRIRRRLRFLHQDEADVRRLERKTAKVRTSPRTKDAKRRLTELAEQIAAKRGAISDHLTARDLAKATGRSHRWVTGVARSVPGVRMSKNQFLFEKSETLSEWIHQQRRLRDLEKKMIPGDVRIPRSAIGTVLLETFRYERTVLRELSRYPFWEWPESEQQDFAKRFNRMVNEIQRAVGS